MHNTSKLLTWLLASGLCSPLFSTETITLRSGNGLVGQPDPLISMLQGPLDTYFPAAFTTDDFAAADAGPPVSIIPNHGAWIPSLPADPSARWISDRSSGQSQGGTFLAAIDFVVTTPAIGPATLDLYHACDNLLGGGANQGVFLNGVSLSGNSTGGGFGTQYHLQRTDIGPLLHPGQNTLYICATDVGGPGGLIFSATFSIEEDLTVAADERPAGFGLQEAWPNPFNPVTNLSFELPETGAARLSIHDLGGREVALLLDGVAERGRHVLSYDASGLSSGVYLARLVSEGRVDQTKLMLIK